MYKLLFAGLVAASVSGAAGATTVTFNSAPQNSIFGPTYSEAGFALTGSNFAFPQSDGFAYTTFSNDGTLTLNYKGPTYTLTKIGGGTFTFNSFQLGNVNGATTGGTLNIAFNGGAATALAIPTTSTLATYTFNMTNLTSVAFSYLPGETANNSLNSYARIDNIVLDVAAVPEPASWAMMIGGLGVVGGTMRRRRSMVALAA